MNKTLCIADIMQCNLCKRNLTNLKEANNHILKCLRKMQSKSTNLFNLVNKKCLQCNIEFSNNLQLHQHLSN